MRNEKKMKKTHNWAIIVFVRFFDFPFLTVKTPKNTNVLSAKFGFKCDSNGYIGREYAESKEARRTLWNNLKIIVGSCYW
ncbi:hypothetical protein GCM10007362_17780 [Saccharibacillus endophyticus]|uniref:Uncharacterized protein n=1 Tax=Saccharibacillus endophyticus TaxID=2060666 RepID=A0ABQ1ZTX0_9BACL|nr:hypothetical protein GCM10007362_17780 [Saccharibacillus endophyticus]